MTTLNLYSNHRGRDLTTQHIESRLPDAELETDGPSPPDDSYPLSTSTITALDGLHHSRGRIATRELCELGRGHPLVHSDDHVLDVGCGLGETSRFLASQYGAQVVGVDLTEEFVSIGRVLTERAHLQDKVKLIRGNALRLPLPDECFDVVLMEHVEMSIADKVRFYKEIARVLKPAGRVLFHDVYLGNAATTPSYPTPWAETEEESTLVPFETIRHAAAASDLYLAQKRDVTVTTEEFFQNLPERLHDTTELGSSIPSEDDEHEALKVRNHIENLSSRRTIVLMGMFTKMEDYHAYS